MTVFHLFYQDIHTEKIDLCYEYGLEEFRIITNRAQGVDNYLKNLEMELIDLVEFLGWDDIDYNGLSIEVVDAIEEEGGRK